MATCTYREDDDDDVHIRRRTKNTQYTHQQTATSVCQVRRFKNLCTLQPERGRDKREEDEDNKQNGKTA